MAQAMNASVEQARRALHIHKMPWLDKLQVSFVAIAVIMGLAALILLAVGVLSTGATRDQVYDGHRARWGGRVAIVVSMMCTWLLHLCWLAVLSITAVLCCLYGIFSILCSSLHGYSEADCIDLTVFRPVVVDFSNANLVLCGGDVQQFCALTETATVWYLVGLLGSVVVIVGLVHFTACLSANHAHITNCSRYTELRDVWIAEEKDLNSMGLPKYERPPSMRRPEKKIVPYR